LRKPIVNWQNIFHHFILNCQVLSCRWNSVLVHLRQPESLTVLDFFLALFDPFPCCRLSNLDLLLELELAQLAVDGLALLSALLLAWMLALPDSRTGLFATNVTDFLPTFFHEIVLARERNLLRPFALPSDWRWTLLFVRSRVVANRESVIDELFADGMTVTLAANVFTFVGPAIVQLTANVCAINLKKEVFLRELFMNTTTIF